MPGRRLLAVVTIVTAALAAAGCGGDEAPVDIRPAMEVAHTECVAEMQRQVEEYGVGLEENFSGEDFYELRDGNQALEVTTPAPIMDLTRALALSAAQCVITASGGSERTAEVLATFTAPGEQSARWENFVVRWTNSPEDGFRATIEPVT